MKNICFASIPGNRCRILTVKKCSGRTCSFYKTEEQQKESLKRAYERLRNLGKKEQEDIARKYSRGKMFWQEGGDAIDG
ncbi:MAG: hypothetical protein HGJ97_17305 [Desulfosporosinus sp.]|nr:hypothetical protein [Desulfosporosinus sp.]